jgi:hypothetical protein
MFQMSSQPPFAGTGQPRRSISLREGLGKTYRWIHDEMIGRHQAHDVRSASTIS